MTEDISPRRLIGGGPRPLGRRLRHGTAAQEKGPLKWRPKFRGIWNGPSNRSDSKLHVEAGNTFDLDQAS